MSKIRPLTYDIEISDDQLQEHAALCHLAGIVLWERRWAGQFAGTFRFRLYHPNAVYPTRPDHFVDVCSLDLAEWRAAIIRLLHSK